jgi:hypothetical protein
MIARREAMIGDLEKQLADERAGFKMMREARATHRCKVCAALWVRHPDGSWSLCSDTCGKCCDVAAMGSQIEPIGITAELEALKARLVMTSAKEAKLQDYREGHWDRREPQSCIEELVEICDARTAELVEARAELAESEAEVRLIMRQGDLLTRTANALHGGPLPNGLWSHHDLPELAQQLQDALVEERNHREKSDNIAREAAKQRDQAREELAAVRADADAANKEGAGFALQACNATLENNALRAELAALKEHKIKLPDWERSMESHSDYIDVLRESLRRQGYEVI